MGEEGKRASAFCMEADKGMWPEKEEGLQETLGDLE